MDEKSLGVLAWPVAILAFASLFILLFRQPISNFLGGMKDVDVLGVKATSSSPQQVAEQKQAVASEAPVEEQAGPPPHQALLDEIDRSPLQTELAARVRTSLTERGMSTDGNTVEVLIQHLAASQIAREFESAYSLIFGSQIRLMKFLNESRPQGATPEQVAAYFQAVYAVTPALHDWSQDDYLQFLKSRWLILTLEDGNYGLTVRGIEFLHWLIRHGRSEDKNL